MPASHFGVTNKTIIYLGDCNWSRTQNHLVRKRTFNHLAIRPVWPNGWVFVYEVSGSGFESSCNNLIIRFRACFEQGLPWHAGNYRVWIHSETRTWHDSNIQSVKGYPDVDLVADCYFENSIKVAEKAQRDSAIKKIANSPKPKVPRDFSKFLSNGENKTHMIELLFQAINKKDCACWMLWEHTTNDLLTWTRVCVTVVNRVLSIFSNS